MTTVTPPVIESTTVDRVVAAALLAWELNGVPVELGTTPINGHAQMPSLVAFQARRVEYVVESDDPDAWRTLMTTKLADHWQPCALVPLSLMGKAHEHLFAHRFELQGWWIEEDRVSFGGIETA